MKNYTLYQTDLVEIGVFAVKPHEPYFVETGSVAEPIIVFPKHSIWIQHEGSAPFVADPTLVNFYNQGQNYQRFAINPTGDYCHWFRISGELLSAVVARDRRHFKFENMRCPADVFLQHLKVLKQIIAVDQPDALAIEEQVLDLFGGLLSQSNDQDRLFTKQHERHKRMIEGVKETLQSDLSVNLSLQQLSDLHHTSPHHLSRVFKTITGQGINHYRKKQRLNSLTLKLQHHPMDLVDLAFDFGFSSHSHMSASFKQVFGMTPSECQLQIGL